MTAIQINGKHDGCFICGDLNQPTEHHIRKHGTTVSVYLCWKHHQIIHGTAIGKKKNGEYIFSLNDLKLVLGYAKKYKLFKFGETKKVRKIIQEEIRRRKNEITKKNNENRKRDKKKKKNNIIS